MSLVRTLVAVAHPHDIASFTSVLEGAEVFLDREVDAPVMQRFENHCRARGARSVHALELPDRAYERIYTTSPIDPDRDHQELAARLAAHFGEVHVPAIAPPFSSHELLDERAFTKKLDLLNRLYDPSLCRIEPLAVEVFGPARPLDIARARSLTHFDQVIEVDDTWSFEQSAYEKERYERTIELITSAARHAPISSVIELGACEGLMTEAIARVHPRAQILAVEPSEIFAARLKERTKLLRQVTVVEARASDVPLAADLIVAAEVLYYAIDELPRMLAETSAKAFVTSYHGRFDLELAELFEKRGFTTIDAISLAPRFEQLLGKNSAKTPFTVRRVGCTIRLWLTSAT